MEFSDRASVRSHLLKIEDKKKRNEEEATMLLEVLNSPGPNGSPPIGLQGGLVDEQGFPRGDVDVYKIRTQRNRLACLRTDRKELEKEITELLHVLHGMKDDTPPQGGGEVNGFKEESVQSNVVETAVDMGTQSLVYDLVPLALVNQVFDSSPAQEAGLMENDRILQFGSVKYSAGSTLERPKLADFAAETSAHFGQPIQVVVLRGTNRISLSLTPKQWQGTGALGCHLMPL